MCQSSQSLTKFADPLSPWMKDDDSVCVGFLDFAHSSTGDHSQRYQLRFYEACHATALVGISWGNGAITSSMAALRNNPSSGNLAVLRINSRTHYMLVTDFNEVAASLLRPLLSSFAGGWGKKTQEIPSELAVSLFIPQSCLCTRHRDTGVAPHKK
jgi:hypothetical protein